MKKGCLVLSLLVLLAAAASGMDVVTMVDTSSSMFPYYDDLQQYLLRDLLEHWLHKGDTFHLLSFADTPETEIAERIGGPQELTAIIDRIYLLRPLGRYTDLVAALDYLYAYLDKLPADTPKLALLLTDGKHDPPPGSPNAGDPQHVLEALRRNADRIRQRGWDIHILRMPGGAAGAPEQPGVEGLAAIEEGATGAAAGPAAATGGAAAGAGGAAASGGAAAGGASGAAGGGAAAATGGAAGGAAGAGGAGGAASGGAAAAAGGASGAAAGGAGGAAGGGTAGATGGAAAAGAAEQGPNLLEEFAERSGSTILPYAESTPETLTEQLTGFPTLTFPGHLGNVGRRFTVPLTLQNPARTARRLTLVHLASNRAQLLVRPAVCIVPPGGSAVLEAPVRLPPGLLPGELVLPVRLEFAEAEVRVSPLSGELSFNYVPSGGISPVLLYLLIALGALLVLAAAVVALLAVLRNRARDRSFQRIFSLARSGRRPIMLRVLDQNPYIGTRNIHEVPPGRAKSVGGDGSTFLIYYLPVPRRIGVLRNDGGRYTFVPRKPQYFASLDKPLADCLDREIVALTARGQRVRLVFHEYVSPLEKINALMRSVQRVRVQSASRTA